MKQVTQRLRDGRIQVEDVPAPIVTPDTVLVDVRASLLSAGTERSKVQTGRQSLVGKARARPDQVRQVIEKAQRDGVRETVGTVRARLDQPSSIGYSAAGVVVSVGARVSGLQPGDRVACGGGGYAVHAEFDLVPGNLCVPLPADVSFEAGAFATVGSVALHGVRQADVRLGESVAVIGLGLVGQLAGQMLGAAGCHVVGIDLSARLVEMAIAHGAADRAFVRAEIPSTIGACDAVVITAASRSSDPVELAALLARDRARVVIVGDVGLDVSREHYYGKELELHFSRSYGPGRYDREYEERGLDYPIGYVRWTERRNMAAVVDLIASGRISIEQLVGERFAIADGAHAYERLIDTDSSPLGIVLTYPPGDSSPVRRADSPTGSASGPFVEADPPAVGVLGAGSFAQRLMIPGLRNAGFALHAVASATGLSAQAAAERFAFAHAADSEDVIADPAVDLVAVATRHSSHAELASRALLAGKSVFVEKPPCLTRVELKDLRRARAESGNLLAVGFNRRHATLALSMREHVFRSGEPLELLIRVAAGALPDDHWLSDIDEGGGRLVGEGCHFVDFACWFIGGIPEQVSCSVPRVDGPIQTAQSFSVTLIYAGGSSATIVYGSASASGVPKERYEAHSCGRSAELDDFHRLTTWEGRRKRDRRDRTRDKGHFAQFDALRRVLAGDEQPPEPDPLATMEATFAAVESAQHGHAVALHDRADH